MTAAEDDLVLRVADFQRLRDLLHRETGIDLGGDKRALVVNRLQRRVRALGLHGFAAYIDVVLSPQQLEERRTAIDLLTTNETYFFREPAHFQFLKRWVTETDRPGKTWRIWSAACSSGEEPFSIAMVLSDVLGVRPWEVLASDVSRRMIDRARRGHYPMARLDDMPADYLRRFCLRGIGPEAGTLLIDKPLRGRVSFQGGNLKEPVSSFGTFDAVFLRNVLIYFDRDDRQAVVRRIEQTIRPGGYLFVSHSESLSGLALDVELVSPSIYRRAPAPRDRG